jgi:hypothetical protein
LFLTPDGPGYNPFCAGVRTIERPVYLFLLDSGSNARSALITALFFLNAAAFVLGALFIPRGEGSLWLDGYFFASIILMAARAFLFRNVKCYAPAELTIGGTVPRIFAFEWFVVFGSMAATYVLLSVRFHMGFALYSDVLLFVLLLMAVLPFALLAFAQMRWSAEGR